MVARAKPDEVYNAQWIARVVANSVRTESGCLLWQGHLTRKGYGDTNYRGKTVRIHRQMYQLHHGIELPVDVLVCHSCDIRNCGEPSHLWVGTNDDNQLDAWQKGRKRAQSATHCDRGHEFTEENTRRYGKAARRTCLVCQRARNRIRAGWPTDLAYSVETVPAGYEVVGASWKHKQKSAA